MTAERLIVADLELIGADRYSPPPPEPSSWVPVDLEAVLSGSWEPPAPTIGRRTDGEGLFYPGKVHTVSSESEGGKTWLALSVVADQLARGDVVLYVDFEDDEGTVVGRLDSMRVPHSLIRAGLRYLRPVEPVGSGLSDLRAAAEGATLAVIDGITEAMTLHGLNPLDNRDIASFGRILPRRLAGLGAAVVCLDHVTKDREGRGRYSLGGVHKLNGLDGAAFVLQNRTPFGIGRQGRSSILIAKDRPGQLRRHGRPTTGGLMWFGDLTVDGRDELFVDVCVEPPTDVEEDFRPTVLMGRIMDAITTHGPLSGQKLEAAVKGKAINIRQARARLQLEGYLSDDTPFHILKPWTDDEDDQAEDQEDDAP